MFFNCKSAFYKYKIFNTIFNFTIVLAVLNKYDEEIKRYANVADELLIKHEGSKDCSWLVSYEVSK